MRNQKITEKDTIGSWITIGHPVVAEIMADAGFDWLAIDLEHSAITIREAEDLIRVIDLKGVVPLVRLSSNNDEQIKRVLDCGAHGIIVPMVNSLADAQKAVKAARYPPSGNRSFGLSRAQSYGGNFEKYLDWERRELTVIVQIEHVDGVAAFEEILSVPGIDAYFVGPYDLSGSLGKPGQFDDDAFLNEVEKITEIASRSQVPGGVHIISPDLEQLKRCKDEGQKFVAFSIDAQILRDGCSLVKHFREDNN